MSFDTFRPPLERLLAQRLGYRLRARDQVPLTQCVTQYLAQHKSLSLETYLTLLDDEQGKAWQALLQVLLNPETYFFRDLPQLQVLENILLPERVAQRRKARVLRLWSAGCSTGEEAYTLAILCHTALTRLGENPESWFIDVVGTDINEAALQTARGGLYSAWSFRQMDPELKARWFIQRDSSWQVTASLQRLVRFLPLNLNESTHFPQSRQQMDIIVCRNVFLYLLPEHIAAIVEGFQGCLTTGGYLLCGHSELPFLRASALERQFFPGSVTYKKREETPLSPSLPSLLVPTPVSVRVSEPVADSDTLAQAQLFADGGNYEQAEALCNRLLIPSPLDSALYILKARIAELRGLENEALEHWEKAIFLDPRQVPSYIELASLYERQGDWPAALRHWNRAEALLANLPSTQLIGSEAPLTVLALQVYVRQAQEKARQNA